MMDCPAKLSQAKDGEEYECGLCLCWVYGGFTAVVGVERVASELIANFITDEN